MGIGEGLAVSLLRNCSCASAARVACRIEYEQTSTECGEPQIWATLGFRTQKLSKLVQKLPFIPV